MTDRNKVEVVCIVDRSGSMEAIREDAQGGLNNFIREQKKLRKDVRLTLVQFDTEYEVLCENAPIKTAEPYVLVPRDCTALLDAVGRTIIGVGGRLRDTPEKKRPGRVIVMIVTDGLENASREFTRERVFKMISHQKTHYSWEFLFIAANQDAICEAESIGIPRMAAMNFTASRSGVRRAYNAASSSVSNAIACNCPVQLPDDAGEDGNGKAAGEGKRTGKQAKRAPVH